MVPVRERAGVHLLVTVGALTAGQKVQAGTLGRVDLFVPAAAGAVGADSNVIGHALAPIAAGAAGLVRLY